MTNLIALHFPRCTEGIRVPSGPVDPVGADPTLLAARPAVPGGHHSADHLARHVAAHQEPAEGARRAAPLLGRLREPRHGARDRRGHRLLPSALREQTAQQDPHARPLRRLPLHGVHLCILVLYMYLV